MAGHAQHFDLIVIGSGPAAGFELSEIEKRNGALNLQIVAAKLHEFVAPYRVASSRLFEARGSERC
jgi:hypothetical protein